MKRFILMAALWRRLQARVINLAVDPEDGLTFNHCSAAHHLCWRSPSAIMWR
jgi:hypothetical protein